MAMRKRDTCTWCEIANSVAELQVREHFGATENLCIIYNLYVILVYEVNILLASMALCFISGQMRLCLMPKEGCTWLNVKDLKANDRK